MSTPELGPDPQRWPANPYELLGVAPGVAPRELRRAYARLIRTYKPEQFPEHFRRIREAYETVLRHLEWRTSWAGETAAAHEPDLADVHPQVTREVPGSEGELRRPATSSPEDSLRSLWELACSGKEACAYQGLRELHDQRPGHAAVCARLYWLLALWPELDTQHEPGDWLASGLRASGLAGPLRELYRREIEENPSEALHPRCARLLEGPAPPGPIADLAELRWRAAGRFQRWDVLASDLPRLRPLLAGSNEATWVRLLLAAVDLLAWAPAQAGNDLLQQCVEEIDGLTHLHSHLDHELDRFEFLLTLATGWRGITRRTGVLALVREVIPLSWTAPFLEVRPRLIALLEEVARDPPGALHDLDQLRGPMRHVFAQLGRLLDAYAHSLPSPPAEAAASPRVVREVVDFLEGTPWLDYGQLRPRLLEYCGRESLAPEVVAEAVRSHPEYQLGQNVHLSDQLLSDWPLRQVCQAVRLFWA